jgi:hypothetical protein
MDIELSSADLTFREDVIAFLDGNAYKPGEDYAAWRLNWV